MTAAAAADHLLDLLETALEVVLEQKEHRRRFSNVSIGGRNYVDDNDG